MGYHPYHHVHPHQVYSGEGNVQYPAFELQLRNEVEFYRTHHVRLYLRQK